MLKYSTKQYRDIFSRLPNEIKDVVVTMDTTNSLYRIGGKHGLHIDQIGNMHDIAMDVMMGITSTRDFQQTLAKELGISSQEAMPIVRDIDEQIFRPIKEVMMQAFRDEAPNKPDSTIATHDKDDTSHESLTKEDILREIENPSESEARKVKTQEPQTETKPEEVKGTELEKYNEELEAPKKEEPAAPSPQEPKQEPKEPEQPLRGYEEVRERILQKIRDKKLASMMTMNKGEVASDDLQFEYKLPADASISKPKMGFSEVLNKKPPENKPPVPAPRPEIQIDLGSPSKPVAPAPQSPAPQAVEQKPVDAAPASKDTSPTPPIDPYREQV